MNENHTPTLVKIYLLANVAVESIAVKKPRNVIGNRHPVADPDLLGNKPNGYKEDHCIKCARSGHKAL